MLFSHPNDMAVSELQGLVKDQQRDVYSDPEDYVDDIKDEGCFLPPF